MGGYGAVEHKPSRQVAVENKLTLDDLPSPEGSWQEAYQKTQKGYNVQLGVYGIAFVVTIVIVSILAVTVALVRLLHFFQFNSLIHVIFLCLIIT